MAEIADVRQSHRWLGQCRARHGQAEALGPGRHRPLAHAAPGEPGGEDARNAAGDHHQLPIHVHQRADGAERMWQRRAEGDCAGQDADGQTTLAGEPAGQDLHRDRVHRRDAGAAERPQRQGRDEVGGEQPERGVGQRCHDRAARDQPAR